MSEVIRVVEIACSVTGIGIASFLIGMTVENVSWRRSKERLAPYDPNARLFKFMRPDSYTRKLWRAFRHGAEKQ